MQGTIDFVQYEPFRIRPGGTPDDVRVSVMHGLFRGDRARVDELLDQTMISRKSPNVPGPDQIYP